VSGTFVQLPMVYVASINGTGVKDVVLSGSKVLWGLYLWSLTDIVMVLEVFLVLWQVLWQVARLHVGSHYKCLCHGQTLLGIMLDPST
jgi:hypothetical protein